MTPNGPSTPDAPDDEPPEAPLSKTTLFCRACGHAGRLDGDWLVREGDGDYHVVCPDCGTVVVAQPGLELPA